ncbi:sigma 54-interacting transcriptional regulator [Rhodopseudomonas palustris]|nr:sigma 54-interacting transcriptional regulator [Rhodopseudomonas palustris]
MKRSLAEKIDDRDILYCLSSGIIATDKRGIITHLNRRSEAKLVIAAKDYIGRDIREVLPLFHPLVHECLTSGKSVLGRQVSLDQGNLVVHVSPILHGRDLLGAVCNFQEPDTFELSVRKSDSYQKLNRQLETIISASSDGIWVCDGRGVIVSINAASEALNGIRAKEVIGRNIRQLLDSSIFDQSVTTKVLASGQQETIVQYVEKTKRTLLCTGTPARDGEGKIVLIVVNERDMTELETLHGQFEQNRKLTEKYKEEISELTLRELEQNTLIADSNVMKHILQKSLKLANIGASNILILGASGTGKGLLAKSIHKNSNRRDNPFIEINCAALPENLLEAELFGYEKGAFTGASEAGKVGLFELAQGGTLFLDEIGDMPLGLQTKLLKYLDDNKFRRLGGTKSISVECATISATNRNLQDLVKKNLFREDLFYRLSSFTLEIPSLHQRRDDIPGLVRFYLEKYNRQYHKSMHISSAMITTLQNYSFPGNVRELKNIIENGVVLSDESNIDAFLLASIQKNNTSLLSSGNIGSFATPVDFVDAMNQQEKQLLVASRQHCRTTREIAHFLNISQPSVVRKLKKHGL